MAKYLVSIHSPNNYNAFLSEDKPMSQAIDQLNDEMIAADVNEALDWGCKAAIACKASVEVRYFINTTVIADYFDGSVPSIKLQQSVKAKRLALPEVIEMLVNSCRLIYKAQQNTWFSLSLMRRERDLRRFRLSQNLK